jgi:GAF domain-containing protein
MLCMPIFDRKRQVIGVAQLMNKLDDQTFSPSDEHLLQDFSGSLGIILETCSQIASA